MMILCDAGAHNPERTIPMCYHRGAFFTLTGLFLELFRGRIKNIFQVPLASHQNLNP